MILHVIDSKQTLDLPFEQGQTILEVLQHHQITGVHAPCGGKGACQKCHVTILNGLETRTCLSCLTPAEDDMRISLHYKERISFAQSSVCGVRAADPGQTGYAIACDVGTTTLICHLMNPETGTCDATLYRSNAQAAFGTDVLSRLQAAADGSFEELRDRLREQINEMIDCHCEAANIRPDDISYMTVVGNTVMMHFLAGLNPAANGVAPFRPESLFGNEVAASELGIHGNGPVFFAPAVSPFIGGDTTACILSANPKEEPRPVLLIDLGTNTEIVLGCGNRYLACAADAGSAFKGSFFDYGVPASKGAISGVTYEDGKLHLNILGNSLPTGLCGSGMLDALAIMVRLGVLDEMGHIAAPEDVDPDIAPMITETESGRAFRLTKFYKVFVTQSDVTHFMLSKAALHSGIQILAKEYGIEVPDISKCLLAGSFGTFIRPESAATLGLIPKELIGVTELLGNAAATGSQSAAVSKAAREELLALRDQITYISLSEHPDFNDTYVDGMLFDTEE